MIPSIKPKMTPTRDAELTNRLVYRLLEEKMLANANYKILFCSLGLNTNKSSSNQPSQCRE